MKNTANKAFTLIELLVVITIISILATSGVSVYTSQIQRGRDTARMGAINDLKIGIEQFYQDDSEYPPKGVAFSGVTLYTPNLPRDPKSGKSTSTTSLDYAYNVGLDSNGIAMQVYEVSTGLENSGNVKAKADNNQDGGNDSNRLEIGIIIQSAALGTFITGDQTVTSWVKAGTPGTTACVLTGSSTATACIGAVAGSPLVIR